MANVITGAVYMMVIGSREELYCIAVLDVGDSAFGAEATCNMEFNPLGFTCHCW